MSLWDGIKSLFGAQKAPEEVVVEDPVATGEWQVFDLVEVPDSPGTFVPIAEIRAAQGDDPETVMKKALQDSGIESTEIYRQLRAHPAYANIADNDLMAATHSPLMRDLLLHTLQEIDKGTKTE